MQTNFLSIYTSNKYKEPEIKQKSYVTKEEFISLFLQIDWSQGTVHTYPDYPYGDPPKNRLFIFDIKNQKSLEFSIVVSNDWAHEFILTFGTYQKKGENKYIGTSESMETACYDEDEMLHYIEDYFNRSYSSIKELKQEAGVNYSYETVFEL